VGFSGGGGIDREDSPMKFSTCGKRNLTKKVRGFSQGDSYRLWLEKREDLHKRKSVGERGGFERANGAERQT